MSKRKDLSAQSAAVEKRKAAADDESSDEEEIVQTDLEFFDPQPAVDFHGLKTLLRQLFDRDHELFDSSALSDLILSQPLLGSTVKTDGNESDPLAFLTVLNMREHKEKPVMQQLTNYLIEKSTRSAPLSQLKALFDPASSAQVGLILTERLINMPVEPVPAMYKMLLEEIQWALEEKEPYQFTHYLIVSKTYIEVESKLDQEENPPSKKKRKDGAAAETFGLFHPEDDILQKYALGHCGYSYTKKVDEGASDSKRTFQDFGIQPHGSMILIDASRFEDMVKELDAAISPKAT